MNGIAPWLQKFWDWRAAGNFICGGTGTGFMVCGAVAALAGAPATPLALVAAAFVAAGLFSVWLELGRPFRSINVLFNAKTSWMTREAMVAAPLFVLAAAAAFWASPMLLVLAAATGLIFLYCQGRILIASKGIPAWRVPQILPLIMSTGITEGIALFLVLGQVLVPNNYAQAMHAALAALVLSIIVRAWALRSYRLSLEAGAPSKAISILHRAEVGFTAFGQILAAVLAAGALLIAEVDSGLAVMAGSCALFGGWYLKFTIIARASVNQGYAISFSPARGAGMPGHGSKPGWS